MSTVRLRRLQSDADRLSELVRRYPRLQLIQTEGTPPEKYQLEYRVKGLRQRPPLPSSVAHGRDMPLVLGIGRASQARKCRRPAPLCGPLSFWAKLPRNHGRCSVN